MKVGFNTNVPYKGKLYHVQTEDCGLKNPVVLTLLYYDGEILASKRTSYEQFLKNPDRDARVQELMKLQHKMMMKELIAGKHLNPDEGERPVAVPVQKSAPAPVTAEAGKSDSPEKEKTDSGKKARTKTPASGKKPEKEQGKESSGIKDSLDDVLLDFIMKKHRQE